MSGGTPWTAGPWVGYVLRNDAKMPGGIAELFERCRGSTLGAITNGKGQFIALLGTTPETIEEDRANARLIARAPAMADAIAEVIGALSWIYEQAENAMAVSAGCANTHGDAGGGLDMLNSTASDIAINASMQLEKLDTLLTKVGAAQ